MFKNLYRLCNIMIYLICKCFKTKGKTMQDEMETKMKTQQKVQLLAPAGNLTKLKIALQYGADAVYGGVSHFSLRNRASKNFTYEDFSDGINYAHSMSKKVYVTINGFPFNSQIESLKTHIAKMRDLSPDAFIVAAPGVVKLVKSIAPDIPIHLSTQANVLNVLDAGVYYDMGVKRIVAAREISLSDCEDIKRVLPDLELEIFVHGSMCFAFSGRCLISALQHGRVPNRGSCANDCRFDYEYFVKDNVSGNLISYNPNEIYVKNPDNDVFLHLQEEAGVGTHIFNAKDLNLASHLHQILQSGVIDALKIEGRTKSTYYAGITTRTYRLAIQDYKKKLSRPKLYQYELHTLKNRGFTDGYIIHRPFVRLDTQNHFSAISEGSYQVCAEVDESGLYCLCKHTIHSGDLLEIISPLSYYPNTNFGTKSHSTFKQDFKDKESLTSTKEQSIDSKDFILPDKTKSTKLKEQSNDYGIICCIDGRYYLRLHKILLQNGKEIEEIHSGNTNPIALPFRLPPFSFLRIKL